MSEGNAVAVALATVGRIVRYVMESGKVRPMIVVEDFGSGHTVNGLVFLDGANDSPVDSHDGSGVKVLVVPVSSAPYSSEPLPGTWHWPTVIQHVEASTAITAEHVETMFARFRENITAKLETHLEAVGKIADGLSDEFHGAVAKLKAAPENEAKPPIGGSVPRVDEFATFPDASAAVDKIASAMHEEQQQAMNATAGQSQEPGAESSSGS